MSESVENLDTRRKGAVKLKEEIIVNGHRMILNYFKSPTYCAHCCKFIWGITKRQGFKCKICQFSCHSQCAEYILFPCKGSDVNIASNNTNQHEFSVITITTPRFCDHCGSLMFGIGQKGLKCNKCLMTVHYKCKYFIPSLCGISCIERRGRICLSIRVLDDRVEVKISEARNLPMMDPNGLADPYVKLKLENSSRKVKTRVIKNTRNPYWNDEVIFLKLNSQEMQRRVIIEVWDYDMTSENDFIGSLSFSISDLIASQNDPSTNRFAKKNWYKLLQSDEGRLMHILIDETLQATNAEQNDSGGDPKSSFMESTIGLSINSFKIIAVIGRGSFGKVVLGTLISNKDVFAIKMLRKDVLIMDDDVESAVNEREVMSLPNPPHFLVKLFCSFQTIDRLYLVLEYSPGGDLMHRLQVIYRFSEDDTRLYLAEIAEAIFFLHSHNVVNRDIKLENVLLDMNGHAKVADFGMAKRNVEEHHLARTFCGTPEYIAPEIIRREYYGKAVDWWSFGIMGYQMLRGIPPFMSDDDSALFTMIVKAEVKYPKSFSGSAISFLKKLLMKDPESRLGYGPNGADMIRSDEFFDSIDWEKLRNLEISPNFKPKLKSIFDLANFDSDFTRENIANSKVDKLLLRNYEGDDFKNFSFINRDFPVEI